MHDWVQAPPKERVWATDAQIEVIKEKVAEESARLKTELNTTVE